ncbi:MAG: DUF6502 family protein [Gammaproteobacteria bacterium]|nr:DUF6502 family protein [Gammaproteobacteria bacterium]
MPELPKHIQLLDASRNALKPLFRIFLRSGISYKDFTEVAKSLFVEISTNEYGLRGRKTNISRVAIMTGLTRKEVKKIRDDGWEKMREDKISSKLSPASAVLHFWHSDPHYLDENGKPIVLAYDSGDPCFLTLAKSYGGDVPSGALFKELIRADAIESEGNKFYPVKRHFVAVDMDNSLMVALESGLARHLSTMDFNSRPDHISGFGRIDRFVWATIPKKKLSQSYKTLRNRVERFVEDIDSELAKVEIGDSLTADRHSKTIGIGCYYFEDDNDQK